MMVFKIPKELATAPMLACAECHNPVPNDMLEEAQKGHLGPCPRCGCTELMDNPYNAMSYVTTQEYDGLIGLAFVGEIYTYLRGTFYTPEIDTEKKKRHHPLVELIQAALGG